MKFQKKNKQLELMFEVHIMSASTIFYLQTTRTISSEQNEHENVILQLQWYLICKLSHETLSQATVCSTKTLKREAKLAWL